MWPQQAACAAVGGAERRLLAGAGTAHLLRSGGAAGGEVGTVGRAEEGGQRAADAPWSGRGAPARSAPIRHPTGGSTDSARSVSERQGAVVQADQGTAGVPCAGGR